MHTQVTYSSEIYPWNMWYHNINYRWIVVSEYHTYLFLLVCLFYYVQLSYGIGIAKPLSIHVDTYGTVNTEKTTDAGLVKIIENNFDLRPGVIIRWDWSLILYADKIELQ